MTDRYIVKATLQLPSLPCQSEDAARDKAAELFREHGDNLRVEIYLNDESTLLYGAQWMAKWWKQRGTK